MVAGTLIAEQVRRVWTSPIRFLSLVAAVVVMGVAPGVASASKYVHEAIADSVGTTEGRFGSLGPHDIAVNQAATADGAVDPLGSDVDGYVYVADPERRRVQVFDANGDFQFMFGVGVQDGTAVAQVCDRTETPCSAGVSSTVGGAFGRTQGVAIDQATGHVFVRDFFGSGGNPRVQEFEADGSFVRAWGWDVVQEGTGDDTASDQFETCFVASECQSGTQGTGQGQFSNLPSNGFGGGIDVHGPSGDVLVADPGGARVQRFDVPADTSAAVSFVEAIAPITALGSAHGNVHVAVGADGVVYAPNGPNELARYDLDTSSFLDPLSIGTLTGTDTQANTVGLEVDPATGNLLVARDRDVRPVVELSNPGGPASGVGVVDVHVTATGLRWTGIGVDGDSDELYLGSEVFGKIDLLVASEGPAPAATVAFLPYTDVTATTATVHATIDSGDLGAEYRFQVAPISDPDDFKTLGSGTVPSGPPTPVSAQASDLLPGSQYVVRLLVKKLYGNPEMTTNAVVPLETVAIPPSLEAVTATGVEDTTARLIGQIDPNGRDTTYRFEWGHGNFANSVPVPDGAAGDGFGYVFVAEALAGLVPNATYQFRLVATNSEGETVGATRIFTTREARTGEARAYELVSPPDKVGGAGTGEWYRGPASLAASGFAGYDGERFAAQGSYGATLLESPFSYGGDWALAERVSDSAGWLSHSPISHPERDAAAFRTFDFMASSDDLSRLVAGTANGSYRPFPEQTTPEWANATSTTLRIPMLPFLASWGGPAAASRWEPFGPIVRSQLDDLPNQLPTAWRISLSDDGSAAAAMSEINANTGLSAVRGLAGAEDPTGTGFDDLVGGRSIYRADIDRELADAWALPGGRELVNVCSGQSSADRTALPAVGASGDVEPIDCPAPAAGRSERLVSDRGAAFDGRSGSSLTSAEDLISSNGKRVFFLAPDPLATGVPDGLAGFCDSAGDVCPPQLFVRQDDPDGGYQTRWISRSEVAGQDATLMGTVRFEAASPDGDKVLFRTNSPLTADDPNGGGAPPAGGVVSGTASNQSWDLYLYDFPDGEDADLDDGELTRVSAGPEATGDCANPYSSTVMADTIAMARFLSDDGQRVLFACGRPLVGSAAAEGAITSPATGSSPLTQTNLYLYDASQGDTGQRWRFVSRLPRSTTNDLDSCATTGYNVRSPFTAPRQGPAFALTDDFANCVRGSADGSLITLFTSGRLTTDDEVGAPTGDVYGYEPNTNRLTRISASQGGAGGGYTCAPATSTAVCHGDGGVDGQTGTLPGNTNSNLGVATHPLVEGDRVAYFQSAARLLPEDDDDSYDVYQWRNGELSLVTPGTSDHALYRGNDRSGRNVFFASRDALTWQDIDVVADVYTARVGGGVPQPDSPPVCLALANACQQDGLPVPKADSDSGKDGGGGNATGGQRLKLARPSAAARRRAARRGVLPVVVRTTEAGRVSAVATAKVRGRSRRVAKAVSSGEAGRRTVRLRLNRAARRQLAARGRLSLAIRVSAPGAAPRSLTVILRRAGR
jgi:hypothetical protein